MRSSLRNCTSIRGDVRQPDEFDREIVVGETQFHLMKPTEGMHELWVETESGRQLLKVDVVISVGWCSASFEFNHASIDNTFYFPALDECGSESLWKSDGTVAEETDPDIFKHDRLRSEARGDHYSI